MDKTTRKNKKLPSAGIPFVKMTGAGNDFLIFDAREMNFPAEERPLFAKSLCRRSLSVGADGVVFIENPKEAGVAFKWDFYNADGSHAEMCGNAARCVARYALEKKISGPSMSFETAAGIVHARVDSKGFVEVDMTPPRILAQEMTVPLGEHLQVKVFYVNTGVPHVVKENDDWSDEYLHEMGAYLRRHPLFEKTGGANVTFYEKVSDSVIHSATFERGVEAVTMACGTGAVAAATAAVRLNGVRSPVEVRVPGGVLFVNLNGDGTRASLSGEARFICEGEIKSEALL